MSRLSQEDKELYAADALELQKNPLLNQLLNKLIDTYTSAMMSTGISEEATKAMTEYKLRAQSVMDLQNEIQKAIDLALTEKHDFEPEFPGSLDGVH